MEAMPGKAEMKEGDLGKRAPAPQAPCAVRRL